jgi:hypothetical protein
MASTSSWASRRALRASFVSSSCINFCSRQQKQVSRRKKEEEEEEEEERERERSSFFSELRIDHRSQIFTRSFAIISCFRSFFLSFFLSFSFFFLSFSFFFFFFLSSKNGTNLFAEHNELAIKVLHAFCQWVHEKVLALLDNLHGRGVLIHLLGLPQGCLHLRDLARVLLIHIIDLVKGEKMEMKKKEEGKANRHTHPKKEKEKKRDRDGKRERRREMTF